MKSDLSVFHRVKNFDKLSPERFFKLALRLIHYDGAVKSTVRRLTVEEQPRQGPQYTYDSRLSARPPQEVRYVESNKAAMEFDPATRGLIEWSESSG